MFALKCLLIEFIQPDFIFSETPLGIGSDDIEISVVRYLFDFLNVFQGDLRVEVDLAVLGCPKDLVVKRLLFTKGAVGMVIQRKAVLAEVLESLPLVDAIDMTVSSTDELF